MEFITPITSIIAIIVAIFSIPKSLHGISELRRKKFKDELDNFTEYFEKFYQIESTKYSKLLRDKAAQNISRSIDMNSELLHYFIKLHEDGLANFDQINDKYYWGSRFIKFHEDGEQLHFDMKSQITYLKSRLYYFAYAVCITLAITVFTGKLNFWHIQWLDGLIGIAFIIFAISSLRQADDMKEALHFLEMIAKAQNEIKTRKNSETYVSIDLAS
jgi:hypothetical protein